MKSQYHAQLADALKTEDSIEFLAEELQRNPARFYKFLDRIAKTEGPFLVEDDELTLFGLLAFIGWAQVAKHADKNVEEISTKESI